MTCVAMAYGVSCVMKRRSYYAVPVISVCNIRIATCGNNNMTYVFNGVTHCYTRLSNVYHVCGVNVAA